MPSFREALEERVAAAQIRWPEQRVNAGGNSGGSYGGESSNDNVTAGGDEPKGGEGGSSARARVTETGREREGSERWMTSDGGGGERREIATAINTSPRLAPPPTLSGRNLTFPSIPLVGQRYQPFSMLPTRGDLLGRRPNEKTRRLPSVQRETGGRVAKETELRPDGRDAASGSRLDTRDPVSRGHGAGRGAWKTLKREMAARYDWRNTFVPAPPRVLRESDSIGVFLENFERPEDDRASDTEPERTSRPSPPPFRLAARKISDNARERFGWPITRNQLPDRLIPRPSTPRRRSSRQILARSFQRPARDRGTSGVIVTPGAEGSRDVGRRGATGWTITRRRSQEFEFDEFLEICMNLWESVRA